jgi:hypothetical protein
MPEFAWGSYMSFVSEPWFVPVLSGTLSLGGAVVGVVLTQSLQHHFKHRQYVLEELLPRYAEFVGIASAVHQTSDELAICAPHAWTEEETNRLRELDRPRHERRRDLQRLAWQIQLLEQNPGLHAILRQLIETIPFDQFVFIPDAERTNRMERLDEFRKATAAYRGLLASLVEAVQQRYHRGRR